MEDKSLEELESEITCGICQEHYTEPKILPCLHYYCKQCILTLAQRSATGKPFHCPECRCAATLPEGGVDQLRTAFFINRLKSKVTTIEIIHGKVAVKCELCSEATPTAEAYCKQCSMFICSGCVQLHTKIQTFKTHEVASLDDLKHSRANPTPTKEPPTDFCKHHKQEPVTLFCHDCNLLICQLCIMKDHRQHNFEFTKKAAVNARAELLREMHPVHNLHKCLDEIVNSIRTSVSEVQLQKETITEDIPSSFKKLHDILDAHERKLMEESNTLSQRKLDSLSVQENDVHLACESVKSVAKYTERCVGLSTDNEVLSMHTELAKRIEQTMQHHSGKMSLVPVEVADLTLEVSCTDAIQELCRTQVIVTKLPVDPVKCTVDLPDRIEVGQLSTITLTTRLRNDKQVKRSCKITSLLKSLYNGVMTKCNIHEVGLGRYSIQCTPNGRGIHELTVMVDGQHVAGSPFSAYVSIHPTALGKPVKCYGVRKPLAITGNSRGEILVSEKQENIYKFSPKGERVKLIDVTELETLRGIACDDKDNIYCIDDQTNKLFTCDKKGEKRKTRSIDMEGPQGRSALLVVNDKLLVAERHLKGKVKVYNLDLQYVRDIQHRDMGTISDLAADHHGNIYAADSDNSCIHAFSSDGVFLRSIGRGKKELQNPWGLCTSDKYLYVTDADSVCVLVFTTEGEFVTSFGQPGNARGKFNCPTHMYADEHGYVYVCDLLNDTIQCF